MAATELLRRGYRVSRPLSNGAPYDLIVDDGKRLHRVQVKKATHVAGSLRINLCSTKAHRGRTRILYHGVCEVVIGVDCENYRFFAFAGETLKAAEIRIRVEPARNGQSAGVKLAADYSLDRIFP